MARDPRINDLSEAVETLAEAVKQLASIFDDDPVRCPHAVSARRAAWVAERMAERLLVNP